MEPPGKKPALSKHAHGFCKNPYSMVLEAAQSIPAKGGRGSPLATPQLCSHARGSSINLSLITKHPQHGSANQGHGANVTALPAGLCMNTEHPNTAENELLSISTVIYHLPVVSSRVSLFFRVTHNGIRGNCLSTNLFHLLILQVFQMSKHTPGFSKSAFNLIKLFLARSW